MIRQTDPTSCAGFVIEVTITIKTLAHCSDDIGLEDESENVYEEDFDVEEERTEISVSRYDIPDVFTQKGSQGIRGFVRLSVGPSVGQ